MLAGWIMAICIVCMTAMGVAASDADQTSSPNAEASEADRMPALDAGVKGSLTVTMSYTDPNLETTDNVKIMPDVQVKLAQVASVAVNGGSADYTLLDAYQETGIKLAGMTASQSNEAAGVLAPLVAEEDVTTLTTDSEGCAVFEDLEPGMYLVFQDTDANTSYRVDAIATFLVAVPYPTQSEGGNSWNYEVSVYPKTELPGPRNNGEIRVTKQLFNSQTQLAYNPPENEEVVFYVGLFTDEACTERAAGTTDEALRFLNSSTAEAVFENLTTDTTYYIAETDGNGNVVPSAVRGDDVLFEALYPDGQSVSITRQEPVGEIGFQNATTGLPQGFYYGGTLTITKKTVMDGSDYKTNDVFYAGLFTDAAFSNRYGDVIALNMNGQSSVSIPLTVSIGTSANDSVTYYVTETDKDGNPIDDSKEAFTMTLNKSGGLVTLTPDASKDEVIITNSFAAEQLTETTAETGTEKSTEQETEQSTEKATDNPKTGDETPITTYVAMMIAALLVLVVAVVIVIGRRRRRER
jgi:hypothetical protein